MRFSYTEAMIDPTFYAPLAKTVEEHGFHTFLLADSICYPRDSDSKYPYNGTGDREFLQGKPFIEPFSLVPALGAVTSKLRFATFVMKLPIREPVLVAKSLASVAVLTNNRFGFGVGISPWPEDFTVCNQDWETRGPRMNEMIDVIRGLLRGGFFEYQGKHVKLPAIEICPVPTEPVPFLIGGHTEPALKRAARQGDGWMFAGGKQEELVKCIARIRELRKEYGTEGQPFEIHASSMDGYTTDGIKRIEDLGVTDLVIGFRNAYTNQKDVQPLEVKIEAIKKYADKVLAKL